MTDITPTGTLAAERSYIARRASSGIRSQKGVAIKPGDTALTRIGANSSANGPMIARRAPFTAASPEVPLIARRPAAPVINVIDPEPRI